MIRQFLYILGLLFAFTLGFVLETSAQTQEVNDSPAIADTTSLDSTPGKRFSWLGLPVVFYTPETRWGFGAGFFTTFRFKKEPFWTKPSQASIGGAYTLNKQILSYLSYRLYFGEEKNLLYGELGYYKYNFFYFGRGNHPQPSDSEIYDVTFPRLRINAMRLVRPGLYLGLRYAYDGFEITGTEPGGILETTGVTGVNGGKVSGFGLVSNLDTRDNILWPSKGIFAEAQIFLNSPAFGSDFSYTRFSLDIAQYIPLVRNQVLAHNFVMDFEGGDPPFYQMALLGGSKKLRGMYEGMFRDRNAILYQMEYRVPLIWKLGIVAFGGIGNVSRKISDFQLQNTRYAAGGGIRFEVLPKEKLHLRLDYGRTKGSGGFYLTVGEAF